MQKYKFITIIIILSLILTGLPQGEVAALEFDPNQIITDSEMKDYLSMNQSDIQRFLESHNGVLKSYRIKDYTGIERSASEIIYNASQAYKINPKWVLATLQKEQSLITNPSPSQYNLDWAMGYAVCDSCSVDDPKVALFKGFGTQVDRATWRIKYYYENSEKFNFHPGQLYNIDGRDVLVYNQATANLYNYTPHIHGNYNFWKIWQRWFAKIYPDGSLLQQEGDPGVWLISNGKRKPFWSKAALVSRFDESKIIKVSKNDLERYEIGDPIKYPNYSLLSSGDGKIYLTLNEEKKLIESQEVFRMIGYHPEEVIEVSPEELAYYGDGRTITKNSIYPIGALLQDNKTGGVYYVEDGIKYPIIDKEILLANYKNHQLTQVSSEELNKYVTAANKILFPDGTMIKSEVDSKVYIISNNKRRWIANEYSFNQLGYEWTDIITVNEKVVNLHPMGETLDLFLAEEVRYAGN